MWLLAFVIIWYKIFEVSEKNVGNWFHHETIQEIKISIQMSWFVFFIVDWLNVSETEKQKQRLLSILSIGSYDPTTIEIGRIHIQAGRKSGRFNALIENRYIQWRQGNLLLLIDQAKVAGVSSLLTAFVLFYSSFSVCHLVPLSWLLTYLVSFLFKLGLHWRSKVTSLVLTFKRHFLHHSNDDIIGVIRIIRINVTICCKLNVRGWYINRKCSDTYHFVL